MIIIRYKLKNIVLVSMFTSLICVLSIVAIPTPSGVPITLQTFIIATCAYTLGTKLSLASVLIYIILGVIGVPVFSNMSSGIMHILGLTGGFITGFIFMTILISYSNKFKNKIIMYFISILGILFCHTIGVLQYSYLSRNSVLNSFFLVSAPFLIKDIFFVMIAKFFSVNLKNILVKNNIL